MRGKAISAWLFLGALFVLCGVLGVLQYRWSNQVSEATSIRLADSLQMSMINWHLDFFRAFSEICIALRVDPESRTQEDWNQYAQRYAEWKNSTADPAVRDGDVLFVPKKAGYVMVNGQVFNATAIGYQPGRSAKWYLSQAGGLTPMANKKAVFVIRADGSVIAAKNNSSGWWSGDPLGASLRAGDTVVVPEKAPKIGGRNWATIMQAAQLASSVALTVAYIHP